MKTALRFTPEFWSWIEKNRNQNVNKLRLAYGKEKTLQGIDVQQAITQIECRQRFGKKISRTLELFPHFYFPDILSGEQATSDLLARFHAQLFNSDDFVVDLTSGLGIDCFHIARQVRKITAIERDNAKAVALKYNAEGLNLNNITVIDGDCRDIVMHIEEGVGQNAAFIDPARRNPMNGNRIFALSECEPDVQEIIPLLKERNFVKLVIKASPMLDISQTFSEIQCARDIFAIGTTTECKELVICCDLTNTHLSPAKIHAVTVHSDNTFSDFSFTKDDETNALPIFSDKAPQKGDLLYVPFPSTMKAAPVKLLSQHFSLYKFHNNTHLYYSNSGNIRKDFPGEILIIEDVISWQSKNLKRFKNLYPNVSVSVRNFGMTAQTLSSRLGVKEGGNSGLRLFGVGLGDNHTDRLLIVTRAMQTYPK